MIWGIGFILFVAFIAWALFTDDGGYHQSFGSSYDPRESDNEV